MHRHWHAFHNGWAAAIAAGLNEKLPPRYFAEPNVQYGLEIDVAAFEEAPGATGGMTAVASAPAATWAPPAPTVSLPFALVRDWVEVLVYADEGGPVLAGAIELVSPANKDRPAHRDAFVAKCESYLHHGVGLVIVDIVTDRAGNLHRQLIERVAGGVASGLPSNLYATAYRLVERAGQPTLDAWEEAVALHQPLPTLPLWLRGDVCVPVELEGSYGRTCRELRIVP